jgi:hypothetical protein
VLAIPEVPDLWTLVSLVDDAAVDAVGRLRRRGAVWWRAAAPARPEQARADAVADLVVIYAEVGQAVEGLPEPYRRPRRPSRDAVLADQLAVVAYDAVLALRAAGSGRAAETTAAVLLAETLVRLHDVDPRPLPEAAAAAAVAALYPTGGGQLAAEVATFGELLLRLERGPGEWQREVG